MRSKRYFILGSATLVVGVYSPLLRLILRVVPTYIAKRVASVVFRASRISPRHLSLAKGGSVLALSYLRAKASCYALRPPFVGPLRIVAPTNVVSYYS